jgi:hypothetical protein
MKDSHPAPEVLLLEPLTQLHELVLADVDAVLALHPTEDDFIGEPLRDEIVQILVRRLRVLDDVVALARSGDRRRLGAPEALDASADTRAMRGADMTLARGRRRHETHDDLTTMELTVHGLLKDFDGCHAASCFLVLEKSLFPGQKANILRKEMPTFCPRIVAFNVHS